MLRRPSLRLPRHRLRPSLQRDQTNRNSRYVPVDLSTSQRATTIAHDPHITFLTFLLQALPTVVAMIDFGLAFQSMLVEDRAVDLYVMERAIETTHAKSEALLHGIYNTYKNVNLVGNKAMTRLNEVRARGRKKSMIG